MLCIILQMIQDMVNAVIPSGMSARGRLTAPNGRRAVHKRFDMQIRKFIIIGQKRRICLGAAIGESFRLGDPASLKAGGVDLRIHKFNEDSYNGKNTSNDQGQWTRMLDII